MGEAVKGTRRAYSVGSLTLYVQPLTFVDDGSTHASALNNVVGFWANCTNEAATSTNAGADVSESSGTFTFNLGEGNRNTDLYILTSELE